jgi:hypothetical protein
LIEATAGAVHDQHGLSSAGRGVFDRAAPRTDDLAGAGETSACRREIAPVQSIDGCCSRCDESE